jgi:hypothetical protein
VKHFCKPLLFLIALSLAACQTDVTPTVTPSPEPPPLAASPTINPIPPTPLPDDFSNLPSVGISNPTAAAQANNAADLSASMTLPVEYTPMLVQIETAGGTSLNGELYVPDSLADGTLIPGIIVISAQFNDWRAFPLTLREAGMIVLQVETRIPPLAGDVTSMFNTLEGQANVDPARLAILGAESGADIALQGCAEDARCKGAALLTPVDQIALVPQMGAFGGRSLWMVVSEEDNSSALTAEALRQAATGPATLQTYQEAGRGTQMLFSQPEVSTSLVNWLRGLFGV